MATSPTDAVPVDELESLLTCSICLETLNEPRTLPCFHSFCKICLEKFVKRHREEATGKKIEVFNCPTCRSEFNLKPKDEVAGMASSHFIRNMLDVTVIQRRAKVSKCSRCQEPAVSRCTTCEVFMCEKCFEAHETWYSQANKKHTVLSINELSQAENQAKIRAKLYCKKHENKTLKFYCETCKELICSHCMLLNHIKQNHSCLSVDEVTEKQRAALRSGCATLDEKLSEAKEALEAISKVTHFLEENAKKVKARITQQKEDILKKVAEKLDEKAQLMINEVDKIYDEMHTDLSEQQDGIKSYVEKVNNSVGLPRSLLEKGSIEEVLSSQKMIEENIEHVKNESPKNLKPVHDGKIEYESKKIDDLDVDDILEKLGEIADHPMPHDLLNDSIILKGKNDYKSQMKEWLDDQFQWRRCYRATRDGWGAQDFHRCCDNKGPTVTVVKVGDYICGGYTDQSWGGNEWKQSNFSFLFSLQNKDNLPPFRSVVYRNKEYAIRRHPNYGPTFGEGHDFHISNNSNHNQESYSWLGESYPPPPGYQRDTVQTKSLLAGSYKFTPTEVEVFY